MPDLAHSPAKRQQLLLGLANHHGRRHGPMAGRHIFAANESIFVILSAIDSPALGGLKTGWVLANSTARQTEV
jgi:hypothetical protein